MMYSNKLDHDKLQKSKLEAEAIAQQRQTNQEAAQKKARERLEQLKNHQSLAALAAIDSLTKNSQYYTAKNLPPQALEAIRESHTRLTYCSKCRFQTACLACDAAKELAHYVKKEADKAGKVPKIIEGPGLKG